MDCPPKNGRCREVTVSVGSTVVALNKTSDRVTVFVWQSFRHAFEVPRKRIANQNSRCFEGGVVHLKGFISG